LLLRLSRRPRLLGSSYQGRIVRWIVWVSLILFGLGWAAAVAPLDSPRRDDETLCWRRTVDGWERPVWASQGAQSEHRPAMHPVLVGVLEMSLSAAALMALTPPGRTKTRRLCFSMTPT
jgi:hypothetical protein